MEGLHLTADCFACQCEPQLLLDEKRLRDLVFHHTTQAGLQIVGEKFYPFQHSDGSAAGITGTLLLSESHVAIHTWPERGAVTLDVYVCNFENNNSHKARQIVDQLIKAFLPRQVSRQELQRGLPSANQHQANEYLSSFTVMQTQLDHILAEVQSPFQHIQIAETPEFGKIMRIDGAMMTSEKDEFFYHEALVHPAAISLAKLKNALIVGGGDGGSTEELLKYSSLHKITLCEIDEQVVKLAREHLTSIHRNAFDSPKVEIVHTDGFAFIETTSDTYDLILLDLTDPISPNGGNLAETCMSQEFFQACYTRLNGGGSLVLHLGSQFYHQERYQSTLAKLTSAFDLIHPYAVFIPLYGALWGMAIARKFSHDESCLDPTAITPNIIADRLKANSISNLRYYSPQTHLGLFAISSPLAQE